MTSRTGGFRTGLAGAILLSAFLFAPPPAQGKPKTQPDKILFDFDRNFAFDKVPGNDAKAAGARRGAGWAMRISTGHRQRWPGLTLKAPAGRWDLARYEHVAMDVRNVGPKDVTVGLRVDSAGPGPKPSFVDAALTLKPGHSGTLKVTLQRSFAPGAGGKAIKLFGMRGYPPGVAGEGGIDPRNVTHLYVFVPKPRADHAFEIDNVRAAGRWTDLTPKKFFPFIDEFGQYMHRDWPGKTHSQDELLRRRREEAKDLAAHPGPADRNKYGGWTGGPKLKATGFFRAEKYKGKWWLVDPEGRLFFSHGTDCVHTSAETPIDDRAGWFKRLEDKSSPLLGGLYGRRGHVVRGYYVGKSPRTYDFGKANLIRKYGKDYERVHAEISHRRLRSWGMNTIANWSDSRIYLLRKTPYVTTIHARSRPIEGSRGYWGKFPDPFDADFKVQLRRRLAREVGKTVGDPWCIGYFVGNELSWGSETSLAEAALISPAGQPAKTAFLADLKAGYGTIDKLNAAWGTHHASWQVLEACQGPPDRKRAAKDLTAFYSRVAETYFRTIRQAVKEVAPKQMYLGCRFAWVNKLAVAAAVKYCDIVSYNLYRDSVADFRMPVADDVPLIIGEFHFGALDRGMFHTGLRATASQAARAQAYKSYVQGALRHRQFVGTHWFKYRDQCTTGRALDGENYQIGFLDVCDTPYPEIISVARRIGATMYEYRLRAR